MAAPAKCRVLAFRTPDIKPVGLRKPLRIPFGRARHKDHGLAFSNRPAAHDEVFDGQPRGSAWSSKPVTISRERELICSASRGVNTFMIRPRIRVCLGGSVKSSQLQTWFPNGHISVRNGSGIAFVLSEIRSDERRGSRKPAMTSS